MRLVEARIVRLAYYRTRGTSLNAPVLQLECGWDYSRREHVELCVLLSGVLSSGPFYYQRGSRPRETDEAARQSDTEAS